MGKTKEAFMDARSEEQAEQYKKSENTGLILTEKEFLKTSKEQVTEIARLTVDKFTDGYNSPFDGYMLAKRLTDLGEAIKTNISSAAQTELRLAKGEKRVINGVTVNEQMTGVRYDFKSCGDVLYNKLSEALKEREGFLKTVKTEQITGDPETGETWLVKPPVTSGSLSLIAKY